MNYYPGYNRRKYFDYDCCEYYDDYCEFDKGKKYGAKKKFDECDCCYRPFQYALKQLKLTGPVTIYTADGGDNTFIGPILSVYDGIVKIQDTVKGNPVFLPICKIVEVVTDAAILIDLLKPCCRPRTGECRCCECTTRRTLKKLKEGNLLVKWSVVGVSTPAPDSKVIDIGEGVVIFSHSVGVSVVPICQITSLEVIVP